MLWVRATCAWVTPSSRAGRMMVKRFCACARWASVSDVSGIEDCAMTSYLQDEKVYPSSALLPSISQRSPSCQNSVHGIPKFTQCGQTFLHRGEGDWGFWHVLLVQGWQLSAVLGGKSAQLLFGQIPLAWVRQVDLFGRINISFLQPATKR